jgi:hypothetical protein
MYSPNLSHLFLKQNLASPHHFSFLFVEASHTSPDFYESFQIKNANEWSHHLPMSNLSLIHLLLVTTIVLSLGYLVGFDLNFKSSPRVLGLQVRNFASPYFC